jgi:uncharacterized protein YigA (DUF484 family)
MKLNRKSSIRLIKSCKIKAYLNSLFPEKEACCKLPDKRQLKCLFPGNHIPSSSVQSTAILPICYNSERLGIIAIASSVENHFNKQLDTLFLNYAATVISNVFYRLLSNLSAKKAE